MGGRIRVESEVGKGSLFSFSARFGLGRTTEPEWPDEWGTPLRELPILVVDDNATSRQILGTMVFGFGARP